MIIAYIALGVLALGMLLIGKSVRIVKQYERGVVFRLGRVNERPRRPGLAMIVPGVEKLQKVSMQIVTMPVPAQEGITRDNVTVRVDAVIYFKVVDPVRAVVDVEDYGFAVGQVAQTSLRSIIGKSDLDDLLTNREMMNQGLEVMIDSPAVDWGVHIDRVEIKDVALPESMKRSMSRQAEAERERRARVITAEGELQASERLSQAASVMAETPAALQLRLLQTVVEVAAEKNSTLVLPFPVELLRFLERSTPSVRPDNQADASTEKLRDGFAGLAAALSDAVGSAGAGATGTGTDKGAAVSSDSANARPEGRAPELRASDVRIPAEIGAGI
ncbi:slipin family protein [Saxibacter everestensis]|uniref:Slipin family protein n=1 Tax=Saxibacter everestensis TaxID=2909229 RepID=A0ABY8QSM5_9MICO|nr:slipin family protein [Brevibacteriaceae bacterium ZFBP1038]